MEKRQTEYYKSRLLILQRRKSMVKEYFKIFALALYLLLKFKFSLMKYSKRWCVIVLVFIHISLVAQTETYTFPRIKSSISIPVSISVLEINRLINNSVKGTIYEDNSFTDNNNDQIKVKVDKKGNIKLTALTGNRLMIEVPLEIWAEKGYGAMGKYVYQEIQFGVVMKFISLLKLQPNWTLYAETKTYGFEWTTQPVLDFGMVKFPISSLIESTLTEHQTKFTTIIDEKIAESFDLKPYLLQVWNQFNAPIEISSEYNTWLKITPQTVYMTPMIIYADYVKATVGLDLYSETYIGQVPRTSTPLQTFPNYISREKIANDFNIQTTANISFLEVTNLAKAQFIGKEFVLTSKKNKVQISDVKVYSEGKNIVIEAETTGEINGTFFIKGLPIYNESVNKITLTDIDFRLKTRNILQKTLALLFERRIKRMIQEEYGIPLKEIEATSRQNLEDAFNQEYYPGFFMKGNVLKLQPTDILLSEQTITVVIDTKANLQLNVSSLNF